MFFWKVFFNIFASGDVICRRLFVRTQWQHIQQRYAARDKLVHVWGRGWSKDHHHDFQSPRLATPSPQVIAPISSSFVWFLTRYTAMLQASMARCAVFRLSVCL